MLVTKVFLHKMHIVIFSNTRTHRIQAHRDLTLMISVSMLAVKHDYFFSEVTSRQLHVYKLMAGTFQLCF